MEKISHRIKQFRISKGMSQESLAEEAGLSLRTIQRVENNETIPRGDSLQRLAIALNTSPDELVDWKIQEDRAVLAMLNFSSLAFIFFPVLGIIVPMIIWISRKDKTAGVDKLGRSILNFQISWSLMFFAYYIMLFTGLWGKLMMHVFNSPERMVFIKVLIPIIVLYLYNILITIINAVLISSKKKTRYVPAIRFLR